jgi:hypothetical protein
VNGICSSVLIGTTVKGGGYGLAIDGTNAYVTEHLSGGGGYVEKCVLTGCQPAPAIIYTLTGSAYPEKIHYDNGPNPSGYLYFGDTNSANSYAIKTDGTLVTGFPVSAYGSDFVTDSSKLYIADWNGVSSVDKMLGGTVTSINTTFMYPRGITWDGVSKLWVAGTNAGSVAQCPLTPGQCTAYDETSLGFPYDIHIIGGVPYFLTGSNGLYKCASAADCSAANLTKISTWGGQSFTYDTNYVYFPDFQSSVYRCPLSGCISPQLLGQNAGTPEGMASDATWIYWVTSTGNIVKVAK